MLKKFISSRDWGAAFGYGLFETMRIYKGHPFLLQEHIQRLMNSSRNLSFLNMPDGQVLIKSIYDYIKNNDLYDEAIRLSVTYGNEAEGIAPQVFITHRKVPYGVLDYDKGIAAIISSYKKNEYSPIVRHKTFNQLENILAQRSCSEPQVKESMFLNTSGYIAEGSKSNIFFIRQGKVFTPSIECGILPGITRKKIIDLLNRQPIEIIAGKYKSNQIYNCDECFCTNSLMEVMPIVKLNGKDIGNGMPGKLTKFILTLYRQYLERYLTRSHIEGLK